MGTVKSKRRFVLFNGLPIKPSFTTVDLSNKIMNHMTPNDFIELPFCESKAYRKTSTIGYFKKLLLHWFTNFTFTPWNVS